MTKISIASAKSKTVGSQAITISGATNAGPIVLTATAHGLETGDIVYVTGVVGTTAANGQFVITVVDANSFSLDNSKGNAAYSSGGSAAHVGFATASITTDTTVFSAVPNNLTFKFDLTKSPASDKVRFGLFDAVETAFLTEQPVFVSGFSGSNTVANDRVFSEKLYRNPSWRVAVSGAKARVKVLFLSATAADVFQFDSWLEY